VKPKFHERSIITAILCSGPSEICGVFYIEKACLAFITIIVCSIPAWGKEPPFQLPSTAELSKIRSAVIETNRGKMHFELFPGEAPWHVANFKYLADKGFYRGIRFHIYQPDYIIQGGSPGPDLDSGPGYSLPPEFSSRKHVFGTLGMARRPDEINKGRRSHGSQFHLLLGDAPHMDGSYTIFGKLVKGGRVLESLRKDDEIVELKVYIRERTSAE